MYIPRDGDILVYTENPDLVDQGIDFFERLEDGQQQTYAYHVAIALNANTQIAAYKRVSIHPIGYDGKFMAYRPPITPRRRENGLEYVKSFNGQAYDYWLIFDDALRYSTRNLIHLPVSFVRSQERHAKVCSSLVAKYFQAAHFPGDWGFWTSPEDVYLAIQNFRVG